MNNNLLAPMTSEFHHNNRPYTTLEGNAIAEDIGKFQNITYAKNTQIPITPGAYTTTINGVQYAFFVHQFKDNEQTNYVKFINPRKVIVNTSNGDKRINLFKLHEVEEYKPLNEAYQVLNNTIRGELKTVVIHGYTSYDGGYFYARDMDHPYRLKSPVMFTILIRDHNARYKNIKKTYIDSHTYLKNVGNTNDIMIIDSINNRSTIVFNTDTVVLTGNETTWSLVNEYSNDNFNVFYYRNPNIKVNSNGEVNCTHVQNLEWNKLISSDFYTEGCAPSGRSDMPGVFFKIRKNKYPTLESFKNKIRWWYNADDEDVSEAITEPYSDGTEPFACKFTIEYESVNKSTMSIDFLGRLPSFYGDTEIRAIIDSVETDDDGNIIAVIPNNGVIPTYQTQSTENKTIEELRRNNTIIENVSVISDRIHIMCFYEHYRRKQI